MSLSGLNADGAHSTANKYIHFLSINISVDRLFDVTAVCLHSYRIQCNETKWNEMERDCMEFLFCCCFGPCIVYVVVYLRNDEISNVKKKNPFAFARFLLNAIKSVMPNDSPFIPFYYLLNSISEFYAVLYWKGIAGIGLRTRHWAFHIKPENILYSH